MPKKPELIRTIDKKIQEEIIDAYTNKLMTTQAIAKRLELRLGWPKSSARYRVKRILEDLGINLQAYPQQLD